MPKVKTTNTPVQINKVTWLKFKVIMAQLEITKRVALEAAMEDYINKFEQEKTLGYSGRDYCGCGRVRVDNPGEAWITPCPFCGDLVPF